MDKTVEQRICLKFCVSNQIPCVKAYKMLEKAYGDACLSKTRAYDWYKEFKEGRKDVQDLPRSGRPATASTNGNIEKIKNTVTDDPSISIREIAKVLRMSHATVHNILTQDLNLKRIDDKWIS